MSNDIVRFFNSIIWYDKTIILFILEGVKPMKWLLKIVMVLCISAPSFLIHESEVQANGTLPIETAKARAYATKATAKLAATSAEKETYQNILTALTNLKSTTTFPADQITYNKEITPILNQVLADHPEIFYFSYEGTLFYTDGTIELGYKYKKATIKKMVKQMNSKVDSIIKTEIKANATDFEKVKAVHDYIVLNTAYDYTNYLRGTIPDLSYSAYGLLINQVAVCDGYAKAMKIILTKAGIPTYYVTGDAGGELHAWNLVKINKKYYYLDTTWDDPVPDTKGYIGYRYFLVPTATLKKDHVWNVDDFPKATSKQYDYFQDFYHSQETNTYFYYSDKVNEKLYRIKKDGSNKTKILDVRAPYFAIKGQTIYFGNYSDRGYIYQAALNGTGLKLLTKVYAEDLYIEGNYLYYTDVETGKRWKKKI